MSSMLMKDVKKNTGVILTLVNAVLLTVTLFLYDPMGWVRTGYENSAPILAGGNPAHVEQIVIQPERSNVRIILKRGEKLPRSESSKKSEKEKENKGMFSFMDSPEVSYNWSLEIHNGADEVRTYKADGKRVEEAFQAISNARRYYSIPSNETNEATYGLTKKEDGNCICTTAKFDMSGGKSVVLEIGRAPSRASDSYVRMAGESRIYDIRGNMLASLGGSDPDYFRNRTVMDSEITKENLTTLSAKFPARKERNVELARTGEDWSIITPVAGPASASEVNSLIDEILGLRTRRFLKEIPEGLDRKRAFTLEMIYSAGLTEQKSVSLEILGETDFNHYLIRSPDKNQNVEYREVSSIYLEDLFRPEEKLLSRIDNTLPESFSQEQ